MKPHAETPAVLAHLLGSLLSVLDTRSVCAPSTFVATTAITTADNSLAATEIGQEVLGWSRLLANGVSDATVPSEVDLPFPRLSCGAFVGAFQPAAESPGRTSAAKGASAHGNSAPIAALTARAASSPALLRKLAHLILDPLLFDAFGVEVTPFL